MSRINYIKQAIDSAKAITWDDLADAFSMDKRTIRKWVKENCPDIKDRKRRKWFTSGEAKSIVKEWESTANN